MMNFCTLFDSYYIHKGIALYLSLGKVTSDFHLYVMAFDKESFDKLNSIGFDKMTVELLDDFETPELLEVKPTRNKAEYCWTCGPSVIHHFIKKYELPELTYLDADLFFLSDPQVVFDEIGANSVAITEQYIKHAEGGKYCVQFMYFRNDTDGIGCLEWWRDRCIEWCYSRYEDGKMGDQKYLEQFEVLFNNVYVVQNRGLLAPWNTRLYDYTDTAVVYEGKEYPFVFFHMHGTKFYTKKQVLIQKAVDCVITPQLAKLFFIPYGELMMKVYNEYLGADITTTKILLLANWKNKIKRFKSKFRNNPIARFLWYKLLGKTYVGFESKKI